MKYEESKVEKMYYSIGEVAKMIDENTSLVRFWEKEFKQIKPKKNKKGNRFFTPKDVEIIKIIHHLVKKKGLTLKGVRQRLKKGEKDILDKGQMINTLENIKKELLQIKEYINK